MSDMYMKDYFFLLFVSYNSVCSHKDSN